MQGRMVLVTGKATAARVLAEAGARFVLLARAGGSACRAGKAAAALLTQVVRALLWMCGPGADGYLGETVRQREDAMRRTVGVIA